ncbi:MAG: hypothetical protein COB53_03050 [Elusimicrobia bacterium]|nr:MAG: hypothetical protein COB53_03050 [Elusimicrobiota bacterium]
MSVSIRTLALLFGLFLTFPSLGGASADNELQTQTAAQEQALLDSLDGADTTSTLASGLDTLVAGDSHNQHSQALLGELLPNASPEQKKFFDSISQTKKPVERDLMGAPPGNKRAAGFFFDMTDMLTGSVKGGAESSNASVSSKKAPAQTTELTAAQTELAAAMIMNGIGLTVNAAGLTGIASVFVEHGTLNKKSIEPLGDSIKKQDAAGKGTWLDKIFPGSDSEKESTGKSNTVSQALKAGSYKPPGEAYLPPSLTQAYAQRNPGSGWGQFAQGLGQLLGGDAPAAYKSLSKAVASGKDDVETRIPLATAANAVGLPGEALESVDKVFGDEKASAAQLDAARAQQMFAKRLLKQSGLGELDKKENLYSETPSPRSERRHEFQPRDEGEASSLAIVADRALRRGDFNKAVEFAGKARMLDPKNVRVTRIGARAMNKLKRYQEAIAYAEAGLRIQPGDGRSLMHKSFAESGLGEYSHAKESALDLLRASPRSALGHQLLARAQAGLGDRTGMLKTLAVGAALSPVLERQYKRALEVPEDEDASLLFSDGVIAASAVGVPGKKRRGRISGGTLAVSGVALVALFGLYGLKRSQERSPSGRV